MDSCGDVTFHGTAEEAKAEAEAALDEERDAAADGWSEDVVHIMWGRVHGRCEQTLLRERTDEDYGVGSEIQEIANYEIVDIDKS